MSESNLNLQRAAATPQRLFQRAPADFVNRLIDPELGPTVGEYNPRIGYFLSVASAWAYADGRTMSRALEAKWLPNNVCLPFNVANDALLVDSNAFLIRSECGRVAIVCYRGTEPKNAVDWLTDASTHTDPFHAVGNVHGGFHRNVLASWNQIAQNLETDRPNGSNGGAHALQALYITGHSLGAAMAAIAAAIVFFDHRYTRLRSLLRGVYTFGQPMIGDRDLASACESKFGRLVFRHVYHQDLVPKMPPRTAGQFAHFGRELRWDGNQWKFQRQPLVQAYTALLSTSVGVAAWLKEQSPLVSWLQLPFSWDDHSPLHYMRCSQRTADEDGSELD